MATKQTSSSYLGIKRNKEGQKTLCLPNEHVYLIIDQMESI